ncbi:MAG: ribosome assembly cofactor RimP [Marinilabiliales bacterium]|nr:MAG: ribosome assembly cofactor RimP [Marinilabiliales bacterium]
MSPRFLPVSKMIDKKNIEKLLEQILAEKEVFPVLVKISQGNKISVFLDGVDGVKIEDCAFVSRQIENSLDRDKEDFELEVSSYGVGNKLLLPVQYKINIGRIAKSMLADGKTYKGKIIEADEERFTLETEKKGKKKSEKTKELITLTYDECRETKVIVSFN